MCMYDIIIVTVAFLYCAFACTCLSVHKIIRNNDNYMQCSFTYHDLPFLPVNGNVIQAIPNFV